MFPSVRLRARFRTDGAICKFCCSFWRISRANIVHPSLGQCPIRLDQVSSQAHAAGRCCLSPLPVACLGVEQLMRVSLLGIADVVDALGSHVCTLGACNGRWIPDTHAPTRNKEQASRGFEPRSLDSGSRVLTVTPRGHVHMIIKLAASEDNLFKAVIRLTRNEAVCLFSLVGRVAQ